jgi:hypothetical protein
VRRKPVHRLGVAIGVVVAVGIVAALVGLTLFEPRIAVQVDRDRSGDVIMAWKWCGTGAAAPEYVVSVISSESVERKSECTVSPSRGLEHLPPLNGAWKYGTAPEGYMVSGTCPRLGLGQRYRATVGGRIGGSATFELRNDGGVSVLSDSCRWWEKAIVR